MPRRESKYVDLTISPRSLTPDSSAKIKSLLKENKKGTPLHKEKNQGRDQTAKTTPKKRPGDFHRSTPKKNPPTTLESLLAARNNDGQFRITTPPKKKPEAITRQKRPTKNKPLIPAVQHRKKPSPSDILESLLAARNNDGQFRITTPLSEKSGTTSSVSPVKVILPEIHDFVPKPYKIEYSDKNISFVFFRQSDYALKNFADYLNVLLNKTFEIKSLPRESDEYDEDSITISVKEYKQIRSQLKDDKILRHPIAYIQKPKEKNDPPLSHSGILVSPRQQHIPTVKPRKIIKNHVNNAVLFVFFRPDESDVNKFADYLKTLLKKDIPVETLHPKSRDLYPESGIRISAEDYKKIKPELKMHALLPEIIKHMMAKPAKTTEKSVKLSGILRQHTTG